MSKEYMLQYLCEPNEHHEKRISFRIITDRGVTHEGVRHRVMSYAQESTRYCNYLKEKFGMSVAFIQPAWIKQEDQNEFEEDLKYLESIYFKWLNKGYKPEQARYFLINGTKTEIVITGFESDWKHFLDLRYKGLTGKPHPDMYIVAEKINELIQNKYE
jgi:thymidylate synthase (FAD)